MYYSPCVARLFAGAITALRWHYLLTASALTRHDITSILTWNCIDTNQPLLKILILLALIVNLWPMCGIGPVAADGGWERGVIVQIIDTNSSSPISLLHPDDDRRFFSI